MYHIILESGKYFAFITGIFNFVVFIYYFSLYAEKPEFKTLTGEQQTIKRNSIYKNCFQTQKIVFQFWGVIIIGITIYKLIRFWFFKL